jgi:cystatin-A/B
MVGGWSSEHPNNEYSQDVADRAKALVEEKLGRTFTEFKVISFKSQIVAGINYLMKIKADHEYLHVQLFDPLPFTGDPVDICGVVDGKSLDDPLSTSV